MEFNTPKIQLNSRILLTIYCVFIFVIAQVLTPINTHGQTIDNVRAYMSNDVIVIEYDLKATGEANEYKIELYGSHNNYREPIRFVTGDVGERVRSGTRRTITWAVKNELVNFTGDVQFEVRGEPILLIKPFSFGKPVEGSVVKRASNVTIEWTGGAPTENVQLQLMQNNQVKSAIGTAVNTGSYVWKIPSNTPKGTYQLSLNGPSGSTMSVPFQIKAKYSTVIKLLPLLVVGGVAAATLGGGSGNGNNDLPTPPDSPN